MPSWDKVTQKRRITNVTEQVAAFLAIAQSEAQKRNLPVSLSFDRSGNQSWCVGTSFGTDACDCTETDVTSAQYCAIDGIQSRPVEDFQFINLVEAIDTQPAGGSSHVTFDPIRGILQPAGDSCNLLSSPVTETTACACRSTRPACCPSATPMRTSKSRGTTGAGHENIPVRLPITRPNCRITRKPVAQPKNQRGLGLMEMMVSMVLSLLAVTTMVVLMANTLGSGATTIQMSRLTQELRASMQLMSRDLRRANYHSSFLNCFGNVDCRDDLNIDALSTRSHQRRW